MTTVNYTGRDYTSRYEALLAQFRTLVPELTDLNHSNAGIALIRLLASESDFLSFYIDWVFNSGYIETAPFKQSLINIGKAVDTLPKLVSPARTTITITRISGVSGEISIPKYSRFETLNGIGFLTDSDVVIASDEETATVTVTQGDLVELALSIDDFESVDYSRKLRYNLGVNVAAYTSVVRDSILSINWTEVDSFYRTTPSDTHYLLELYAQPYNGVVDTVFLTLCKKDDDLNLPEGFNVTYLRSLGYSGNTEANTITVCPASLDEKVTVTNLVQVSGGGNVETIDELRWRIPATTRTQRRAVTTEDYRALISGISGVKYCEAIERSGANDWPFLHVVLYIVTDGGGDMPSVLRQIILDECCERGHLGEWPDRYLLLDATQIPVNITARVGITSGHDESTVLSSIRTALQNRYSITEAAYFKQWDFAELHYAVSNIEGVSWVEFSAPSTSQVAGDGEILVLGTVSLTQGS